MSPPSHIRIWFGSQSSKASTPGACGASSAPSHSAVVAGKVLFIVVLYSNLYSDLQRIFQRHVFGPLADFSKIVFLPLVDFRKLDSDPWRILRKLYSDLLGIFEILYLGLWRIFDNCIQTSDGAVALFFKCVFGHMVDYSKIVFRSLGFFRKLVFGPLAYFRKLYSDL